jgi:hypothetical protein
MRCLRGGSMRSRLNLGVAALLCAAVASTAPANADTVIFSSVPDLGGYAFNNAYCSDCGPLAGDEPLAAFSLSSAASITGLNLATGPIYGSGDDHLCLSLNESATQAELYFRGSVENQQVFDSGYSAASWSVQPHRHISSGIRPTEQTSWLSSRL